VQRANLLAAVRHWWAVLLLAVVLSAAVGYQLAMSMPVEHEARVRLLVGATTAENRDLGAAGQLTRTYGELVTSERVVDGTIETLGLSHSASRLRGAIRPTADSATRILIIRVRDADPDLAAAIANELAEQLNQLPMAMAGGPNGALLVIDRASPGIAIGVPTTIIVGLAAFAGLVVAVTLVLLLENLNRTIRREDELAEVSGADYLGRITGVGRRGRSPDGPGRAFAETSDTADHRMLATKLELIAKRDGLRSVLVLGVGRTYSGGQLAANTAVVLAERHQSVMLVDANQASHEITLRLGLEDRLGLTDMLEVNDRGGGDTDPGPFTFTIEPRLGVVPFGRAAGSSPRHATGASWALDRLLGRADVVVVNAASADRSAAALEWAGAVDATVLVVPRSRVRSVDVAHLVDSLRLVGGRVIGVVFEDRRHVRLGLPRTGGRRDEQPHRRRRSRGGSDGIPASSVTADATARPRPTRASGRARPPRPPAPTANDGGYLAGAPVRLLDLPPEGGAAAADEDQPTASRRRGGAR
jgi:polysaccharide biosynthesis transport protein